MNEGKAENDDREYPKRGQESLLDFPNQKQLVEHRYDFSTKLEYLKYPVLGSLHVSAKEQGVGKVHQLVVGYNLPGP